MLMTLPKHTFTPLSSSAERQAHNLEVTGSTPVGGILSFRSFIERTLNPPASAGGVSEATCQAGH